jgi:hypothetical protein
VPAGLAQNAAGHQEDAGSNHRADHDEDQVAQTEDAVEGAVRYLLHGGTMWFMRA